jgi:hypothetical protein
MLSTRRPPARAANRSSTAWRALPSSPRERAWVSHRESAATTPPAGHAGSRLRIRASTAIPPRPSRALLKDSTGIGETSAGRREGWPPVT